MAARSGWPGGAATGGGPLRAGRLLEQAGVPGPLGELEHGAAEAGQVPGPVRMPGRSRRDCLAEQRHALAEQGKLAGVKESREQVAPAGGQLFSVAWHARPPAPARLRLAIQPHVLSVTALIWPDKLSRRLC